MTYPHREAVGFVWAIADLLRGTYKAHDYGDVILPLVVLRRLDQALNRMRAFQGGVGETGRDGLVSPDYAVLQIAHGRQLTWGAGQ